MSYMTYGIYGDIVRSGINCVYYSWLSSGSYYSIATYTRDAIDMVDNTITIRQWRSYGYLVSGVSPGGLFSLNGSSGMGLLYWYFATYDSNAINMENNIIGYREWLSFGGLRNGIGYYGLSNIVGTNLLSSISLTFATILSI